MDVFKKTMKYLNSIFNNGKKIIVGGVFFGTFFLGNAKKADAQFDELRYEIYKNNDVKIKGCCKSNNTSLNKILRYKKSMYVINKLKDNSEICEMVLINPDNTINYVIKKIAPNSETEIYGKNNTLILESYHDSEENDFEIDVHERIKKLLNLNMHCNTEWIEFLKIEDIKNRNHYPAIYENLTMGESHAKTELPYLVIWRDGETIKTREVSYSDIEKNSDFIKEIKNSGQIIGFKGTAEAILDESLLNMNYITKEAEKISGKTKRDDAIISQWIKLFVNGEWQATERDKKILTILEKYDKKLDEYIRDIENNNYFWISYKNIKKGGFSEFKEIGSGSGHETFTRLIYQDTNNDSKYDLINLYIEGQKSINAEKIILNYQTGTIDYFANYPSTLEFKGKKIEDFPAEIQARINKIINLKIDCTNNEAISFLYEEYSKWSRE